MSTFTVTGAGHRATHLDDALAFFVARLDSTLVRRAARRAAEAQRAAAQDHVSQARRSAQACGSLGILPR